MPQAVPNGWAEDTSLTSLLPSTPQGEIPIKSEITYNGNKYAVITNSKGEYKVFLGGTGILNQQISENAEIYGRSQIGKLTGGIAWNRKSTKDLVGGAAGSGELVTISDRQISEGLSKYLTAEEKNNLQNLRLKSFLLDTQPTPPPRTPEEPDDGTTPENNDPEPDISPGFEDIVDQTKNFDQLNFDKIKQYFKYPEFMNDGQDRIVFTQYKYVATKINTDLKSTVESFANRNKELQTTKIEGSVTLPIPNQIAETNQTGWGESSLTTIGALAMGGLAKAGLNFSKFKLGEGVNDATTLAGQLLTDPVRNRAQSFLAAKFASQIISKIGVTVDPDAYITRVTGGAINPNLELLFNGPKLRPFSFTFKMTARSEKEAKNIRAIVKFFKAGMAPQRSKKNDASLFLGAPNVFQIEYKSKNEKVLDGIGRIKICALQSCAINYTPDGAYAAYDDDLVGSQPIAIEMQLQLIEITPVFADEYNLEDGNVPIGPEGSGKFTLEPESNTQ